MLTTGWSVVRLGEACIKIGSGATPRGGSNAYLAEGPFSLIRSQNVRLNAFSRDGLAFISDEQAVELRNVEVLPHDVLLNITGDSVARACQVDSQVLPARVNQHVAIVRPNPEELDPRFLLYWLVSPETQSHLMTLAGSGATRNALTKAMIEELRVPKPPLPTQHNIASVLGALDDKIELNRRMAATLEEMARAIFKSWFIDFDPVHAKAEGRPTHLPPEIDALFPDSFEDSELGPIPRGWRIGSIAELATVGGGSTPSTKNPEFWDGEFAWATPKDLSKLSHPVLLETERSITEAGLKSISSGLYTPGTVLMSSRAPIGYLAITEIPVAVNQGFIALQPSVECGNLYLLRWLEFNMDAIHGRANGSTFMEISKSAFRSIETVLPSNETIGAFGKVTAPLHRRLVAATKESGALSTVRDTLLPKLIAGEVRVEAAERICEDATR